MATSTVGNHNGKHSLRSLIVISAPAFSLSLAFGINNPGVLHYVLSRFIEEGLLDSNRLNTALGFIGICGLITSALMQPLVGMVSDRTNSRFGRRYPFMFYGVFILLISFSIELYAPNLSALVFAVFMTYFGLSLIQSPSNALIPDQILPHQTGIASGIKTTLELIGAIGAGIMVWLFLGDSDLPFIAMLITLILLVVSITLSAMFAPDNVVQRQRPSIYRRYIARFYNQSQQKLCLRVQVFHYSLKHILRRQSFMWWLLQRFSIFVSFGIISKFSLTYLQDGFGYSASEARSIQGQMIFALGVVVMITPIAMGMLSDKIGRRKIVIWAGVAASFGMFGLTFATNILEAGVLLALIGGGTSIFFSVGWALVANIVPSRQAALYMGITNIATSLGSILGLSGGYMIDSINTITNSTTIGYKVIFIIGGIFYLVASFSIFQTRERISIALGVGSPIPATQN